MAFKGSLQDIALPDILQLISAQGMRGVLTLTRDAERLRIQVIDGRAMYADSNLRPLAQRLAATLVSAGRLSRDDLKRALEVERKGKHTLGKVLVDLGLVPVDVVRRCFTVHYQQMIYNVLRWNHGNYDFQRCDVTPDEDVDPIVFQNLLMSGMQMIDEWPMVESRINNREAIVHRTSPATDAPLAEEPELSELAAEVLTQIDGKSTIQVLIDRSMQLEFDVCRALYDLMEQRLVTMAFEGSLSEVGLPEVVHAIRCTASTGQVELRSDDVVASIWFSQGDMVDAHSSDPDETLGPYLLQSGVIGRSEFEAAAGATTSDQVGEWLVQRGRLTQEALDGGRLEQKMEVIASRFSHRRGRYRFIPGNTSPTANAMLARLTPAIVMKGIRAIQRWSQVAAAVGDPSTEYRFNPGRSSAAWSTGISADQQRLLELFAGGQTVERAREQTDVQDYELHQLVWWGGTLGLLDGAPLASAAQLFLAALSGNQQINRSTDVDDLFAEFRPDSMEPPTVSATETAAKPPATQVAAASTPAAATADHTFDVDFTDMLRPREPDVAAAPLADALDLDELAGLADLLPDEL